MTLIDQVEELKKLEAEAAPNWTLKDNSDSLEYQVVSGDIEIFDDGSAHGEYSENFRFDDPNIRLAVALRNAAPDLLKVAGMFHPGDKECLQLAIQAIEFSELPFMGSAVCCLRRLQRAAHDMEAER